VTVQDEGFHEIQLNGKQVVFLFMAATVVSVVIFLCGVLVGRGVRVDRPAMADLGPVSAQAETTPPPSPQPAPAAAAPAGSDPRSAAPPPDTDDLSYFNRLETKTPPRENLKSAVEKRVAQGNPVELAPVAAKPIPAKPIPDKAPAEKAPREKAAVPPERTTPPPAKPAAPPREPQRVAPAPAVASLTPAAAPDEPAGSGFAVQIAALNVRGEAEAIAKRLNSKGYMAYVLVPSDGTPSVFRVRIGKFPTRHEAETIAAKLKKEEQFNPWVTR
jgi:cell division septation protein DedD